MAGVQRGGRGEVKCEREARRELNASAKRDESATKARSLGARRERAPNDRASRSHSTSPSLPFVRRPRRLYRVSFMILENRLLLCRRDFANIRLFY